ncbi:MAG TPA: hypothetical protein VNJ54_06235 [Plantibacter sp.]|uniref:hypothetical protein n=1 Tax=unclassified Plantibacter TaxID=2624265 RepID=UPI002BB2A389|nr:hypothetical protein [Plantibacter sp.]
MDSWIAVIVIGVVLVVASGVVLLVNHRVGRRHARQRQERFGGPDARHAGGRQSQRGRVFTSGSTNHQQTPNS